jgi:F-type H+-transporting ATPase subunit gamma
MEDLERIHERLDNIKDIEPLLAALRTIAASGWHLSRTRLAVARAFVVELTQVLQALKPHLPEGGWLVQAREPVETVGMLVIASERGLCGNFNDAVLQGAEQYIAQAQQQGYRVELITLGARAEQHFRRRGVSPLWAESLPVTRVASLDLARALLARLQEGYDAGRYDRLDIIYMPYRRGFVTEALLAPFLPLRLPVVEGGAPAWPTPLIDADPQVILRQAMTQWALAEFYRCLIESAASEQSARFRMLDGASDNSRRLIEELTANYHVARQHAITMELLDLASGAGLLNSSRRAQSS